MSESRQDSPMKTPAADPAPEAPQIERARRRQRSGPWFIVSAVLHGAALVALIYFTPLRELVPTDLFQHARAEQSMSSDQLADLSEAIESRTAEQVRENIQQLEGMFKEIRDVQSQIGRRYDQFAATQQQTAAQDAAKEMQAALDQMAEAQKSIEAQAAIETTDRHQALAEQAQERADRKLDQVDYPVREVKDLQKQADQTHQEAKTAHDQSREAGANRDAARRQVEQEIKPDVEKAKADLADAQKKNSQRDQERAKTRLAERETRLKDVTAKADQYEADRAKAVAEAAKLQKAAAEKQAKALQALQKEIAQREQTGSAGARTARTSDSSDTTKIAGDLKPKAADAKDVPELYELGKRTEDQIAESFKEVRAMDLAMVRDMKLTDAREDIDVVRPVRPKLDAELLREAVETDARFDAHKEELKKALRETNSMVNLASRMLEMSRQSVKNAKFGTDAAMAEPPEGDAELALRIKELAMEDVSGRFADVSGLMQQMQAGAPAGGGKHIDYKDLTKDTEEKGPEVFFGQEGEEKGDMPQLTPDVPAVGARVLSQNGQGGRWMYVDSWYTLGPFPNPERRNIDREFPPDSLVDLDATYVGKGGRTIRWKFVQTVKPQVVPADAEEYGIWYAYTELYCDRPRDILVAMGTDDRGTLKINGVPVWISSKRLKGWDIDEVWRRVHLNQGTNRILYRVENGWHWVGFSLVLRVPKE